MTNPPRAEPQRGQTFTDPPGEVPRVSLRRGTGELTIADPESACAGMMGVTIPFDRIGTSTMTCGDATITDAVYSSAVAAILTSDLRPVDNAGNSTTIRTPAKPDFCQLTGSIAPATKDAQPIGFRINLPTAWNGSSVQFGGGGFNGRLFDASGYLPIQANAGDVLAPLMRGYMTISTDSGHLVTASPRFSSADPVERAGATFDFALNPEMFGNFARDAYKKVYDVAQEIAKEFYGRTPDKRLWVGGSEGGREGLLMAQEFPKDFDGIFVRAPGIGWTGAFCSLIATVQAVERDDKAGAFSSADIELLGRTSADVGDKRDGIGDAVLSDYLGCQEDVLRVVHSLQRTGDAAPGTYFTAEQIRVIDTIFSRLDLGFALPNGLDHYPGCFFGGEPWSLTQRIVTDRSLSYGDVGYPILAGYGIGAAKFVFSEDPSLDVVRDFARSDVKNRMAEVSVMMDALNPDMSAFAGRGAKLILLECTADCAQSAAMGMEYYDTVVSAMGKEAVDGFMRVFVSPGTDHVGGGSIDPATLSEEGVTHYGVHTSAGTVQGVPRNVDWLSVLEDWVWLNQSPGDCVIATSNNPAPPFETVAAKPVCRYPLVPRYTGGDPASATSYTCQL